MALECPGRIADALRSRVVALTESSEQWRRNRRPRPAISRAIVWYLLSSRLRCRIQQHALVKPELGQDAAGLR
jgi:hypothetical protein